MWICLDKTWRGHLIGGDEGFDEEEIENKMINRFQDGYRFLSNFYPSELYIDGELSPTVEHYYQASKSLIPHERKAILQAPTPGAAKRLGNKVKLRADWDEIKEDFMLKLLRKKFNLPHLKNLLIATKEEELIEGNYWHDTFWGVCYCPRCKGIGQNKLGQMLMQVRLEVRENDN